MKHLRYSYLVFHASLLGLLSGCLLPQVDTGPTAFPPEFFPTVVVETAQAAMATDLASTPSLSITASLVPTETPPPSETPTPIPTDTATPSPSAPNAQIQIHSPGAMSKVTSPISLRIQVVSGGSHLVLIDLHGEDGRKLFSILRKVKSLPGGYGIQVKIPFEILAAAELGRITISTKDTAGSIEAQMAMRVLLLSIGEQELNPAGDTSERVVFYSPPRKNAVALDGLLNVEGRYLPFNDLPVVLELYDLNGKIVGLRVLDFDGIEEQLFTTTIPYKVEDPTHARLVLRQEDDRLEGTIYIYSQDLMLYP